MIVKQFQVKTKNKYRNIYAIIKKKKQFVFNASLLVRRLGCKLWALGAKRLRHRNHHDPLPKLVGRQIAISILNDK